MQHLRLIVVILAVTIIAAVTPFSLRCPYCFGKFCGVDAVCNNKTRQCECQWDKPFGNPVFSCHGDSNITCDIVADPSATSFTGSQISVNIPCRVSFAQFNTPFLSKLGKSIVSNFLGWTLDKIKNRCDFRVDVVNAVSSRGTIYVDRVIVDVSLKVLDFTVVTIQIELSANEVSYTVSYGRFLRKSTVLRGDTLGRNNRKFGDLPFDFKVFHDTDLLYWTLDLSICGDTQINFRSWNKKAENQPIRPGLSITTNEDGVRFPGESLFPRTLCDSVSNDVPDVYEKYCAPLDLSRSNCALNAFLNYSPDNQTAECSNIIRAYRDVPGVKRLVAVRQCGPVLSRYNKCVASNGLSLADVLRDCFNAVRDGQSVDVAIGDKIRCKPEVHPPLVQPR